VTEPYRQLALVEPLPSDPVVRALRLAGARPFCHTYARRCPFCESPTYTPTIDDDGRVCNGPWRWWRPWGCSLYVPHFHVHCFSCTARWIMATADTKL
jgi:hypothetical protein